MSRAVAPPLRTLALLAVALGVGATLAAPRPALADKIKDDDALNYFLKVPDRWTFGRTEDYAKQSVVAVADCVLDRSADGKTAGTGQGARVMLSVEDVPKDFEPDYETWLYEWQLIDGKIAALGDGDVPEEIRKQEAAARERLEKPLSALAGRPDVQSLLLGRWSADGRKTPALEPDARGVWMGHLPAAEMKYEANAPNLQGNDGPCLGRLHVWVVGKRLYRMAFWIWPNPRDRAGLKDDVDSIEFEYRTPRPAAVPRKPPAPDKGANPDEPKTDPEIAREYLKEDPAFKFAIKKVSGFKPSAIDYTVPDQKHVRWRMDGVSGASSCTCELLVFPVKNPFEALSVDQYLKDFWTRFLQAHPNGKLETAPFPPVTVKQAFLSLPDFAKTRVVPRPEEKPGKADRTTVSDEERLGVVAESKDVSIGKERTRSAWRLCLLGTAERLGDEAAVEYVFQPPDFCYVLRFVCRRDGVPAFRDAMARVLASFSLL